MSINCINYYKGKQLAVDSWQLAENKLRDKLAAGM
jgi:hypothetical protein